MSIVVQGFRARRGFWRRRWEVWLPLGLMALGAGTSVSAGQAAGGEAGRDGSSAVATPGWEREFFRHCAFVCVDIQPATRRHLGEAEVPKLWHKAGFTAADVNAATDYAFDVAYPNARRVADGCRSLRLPMIFLHWGCLFRDGMDLDPEVRRELEGQHGTNYDAWGHCVLDPNSRPGPELGVRPGEYVLPKTAQDAFISSNLGFVLTNLHVKHIVFIWGAHGSLPGQDGQERAGTGLPDALRGGCHLQRARIDASGGD